MCNIYSDQKPQVAQPMNSDCPSDFNVDQDWVFPEEGGHLILGHDKGIKSVLSRCYQIWVQGCIN